MSRLSLPPRHGPKWLEFRTRVQQVMLQPRTAKLYVGAIQGTADSFIRRSVVSGSSARNFQSVSKRRI